MSLRIVCSGFLLRYPLGGFSFHHLQYLVGLKRLGHEVTYFEHFGWPSSCYDPAIDDMTANCSYGVQYLHELLHPHELAGQWCYLSEDGTAHGMSRDALATAIRDCDVYLNISNINWIDELNQARRRVLIDTDPVFTQIKGHGMGGPFERYHARFTYGENVHHPSSSMPTGNARWLPTRQPIVPDLWPASAGDASAPITTVMNWSAYGEHEHDGKVYGQKDREFAPFVALPRECRERFSIGLSAKPDVQAMLRGNGWQVVDGHEVTRSLDSYRQFIRESRAEFSVAKHGYVATQCGWFSDRSAGYLASGRPVVVQDTGFSRNLPCGKGLLAWRTPAEAKDAIDTLNEDYGEHCRAARAIVEEHFHADRVLNDLLEKSVA